jgi:hypothetical protein
MMGIPLIATGSISALGTTQRPIQWVMGVVSPRLRRPGCESDHSPESGAEVKNV